MERRFTKITETSDGQWAGTVRRDDWETFPGVWQRTVFFQKREEAEAFVARGGDLDA